MQGWGKNEFPYLANKVSQVASNRINANQSEHPKQNNEFIDFNNNIKKNNEVINANKENRDDVLFEDAQNNLQNIPALSNNIIEPNNQVLNSSSNILLKNESQGLLYEQSNKQMGDFDNNISQGQNSNLLYEDNLNQSNQNAQRQEPEKSFSESKDGGYSRPIYNLVTNAASKIKNLAQNFGKKLFGKDSEKSVYQNYNNVANQDQDMKNEAESVYEDALDNSKYFDAPEEEKLEE